MSDIFFMWKIYAYKCVPINWGYWEDFYDRPKKKKRKKVFYKIDLK